MVFEKLVPMLRTWDLSGSLDFWTNVLGFHCERFSEGWGWACLSRDGIEIVLSSANARTGELAAALTGALYTHVDHVDGLWKQFGDRARVCCLIDTFDYGMREFAVDDNNGYLVQFGTVLSR